MIETALNDALEAAMRGSADLAQAMGGKVRLYPLSAPNDAPFPHIIYGENQILDWGDDCTAGHEIYAPLKVWTQDNEGGPVATLAQAGAIGGLVRALLNTRLAIAGHRVIDHRVETNRYMADGDGLSALGLVELRYWVEASA